MREYNLRVRVVGGRHSPLLIQPDIFVVMDNFRHLYINIRTHTLTVGAGYNQGQVNDFLFQDTLRIIICAELEPITRAPIYSPEAVQELLELLALV